MLIYIKSIGHCLSPQKISLLYVLYLEYWSTMQRYGVLEIAQNKTWTTALKLWICPLIWL